MDRARRAGFTLVELLVVIAVIALLAAILLPVFARARAKAQQTTCLSNIKQFAAAFELYVSDYDDTYPSVGNYWASNSRGSDWVRVVEPGVPGAVAAELGSLYSYVKNNQIYICPTGVLCGQKYQDPAGREWVRPSYTMNSNLADNTTWLGIGLSGVIYPSKTFLLTEENDSRLGMMTGDWNDGTFYAPPASPTSFDKPPGESGRTDRHGGGGMALFCDGHAKWLTYDALVPWRDLSRPATNHAWYQPMRSGEDTYP